MQPSTAVLEHVLPRVASWRRHAVSATEDAPDPRSGPSTAVRRWLPARPAEGYDDEVSAALDDNLYNNSLTFRCTVCYITTTQGVAAPHFRHQNNSYTYALTHMHNYHN